MSDAGNIERFERSKAIERFERFKLSVEPTPGRRLRSTSSTARARSISAVSAWRDSAIWFN